MTETYYSLLGVAPGDSPEAIDSAYQRQRERYRPELVATLGEEFQRVARERLNALERAYTTLSDPERRRTYDRSIGVAPADAPAAAPRPRSAGLSRREVLMAGAGALIGLLLIGAVWFFAGRSSTPDLPPVASVDRPADNFQLQTLDGKTVQLSDYRGKVVILNFWYTGCAPCREETPALQSAYQQLKDRGLVILGVNVRPNERTGTAGDDDIRRFTETYGVSYPIPIDRDGMIGRDFQVFVLPTNLIIDQRGTIRYARFGTLTTDDVEQIFTKLQREASAQR